MSTRTPATRPASRTGQKFPLRKVGSEATKPKPGPKPVKPTPPSYASQDAETGVTDTANAADDVISEAEEEDLKDEETEQAVPDKSKAKGPTRSKSSKMSSLAPKQDSTSQSSFSAAAHMAPLSLVYDYKPVPGKPSKLVEYVPSTFRMMAMQSEVAAILSPLKAVHKDDPTYNPVFARLALSYCLLYNILAARENCNLLSEDEAKVIKRLRLAHDFERQAIPGPYVLFLQSIGFHTPADARFDVICPALPNKDNLLKIKYASTDKGMLFFPHFPALLALANIVATDGEVSKTEVSLKTDGSDDIAMLKYWDGKHFCLRSGAHKAKVDSPLWGIDLQTVAQKMDGLKFLSQNAALHYPFYARASDLEKVSHSLNIDVPTVAFPAGKTEVPTLMHYFGVQGQNRWLPSIMESLTYESKFFKGLSTLGNIGFETGENILCISKLKLTADDPSRGWHQSLELEEEGHTIITKMEGVSDGDMAIANLCATITCFEGGNASSYATLSHSVVVKTPIPENEFNPYSSHVRKIIHDAPLVTHRFHSMLKTEMLLKLSDVIGV